MKRATSPGQLCFGFAIAGRVVRRSRPLSEADRAEAYSISIPPMPETDLECQATGLGWAKPCPHFRCRYHLGADVKGEYVTVYRDGISLDEHPATCSLAVARHGARTETQISAITGISLRTVERDMASAIAKIKAAGLEYLLKE